jgi:hypothetical protein
LSGAGKDGQDGDGLGISFADIDEAMRVADANEAGACS